MVKNETDQPHPLDPLSASEIALVADILQCPPTARIVSTTLIEPPKEAILAQDPHGLVERGARVVVRDKPRHATYESRVSLTSSQMVSWDEIQNSQPLLMEEEFVEAEHVVKQNTQWRAALQRRGVTDYDLAAVDLWMMSLTKAELESLQNHRVVRALTWVRTTPNDNAYAKPVEGLVVVVDLDDMNVVSVTDSGVTPLPRYRGEYTADRIQDVDNSPSFPEGSRQDLKPLELVQAEGPSFTVEGHRVLWQKWDFRVGFTPREGLILHCVQYNDRGRLRPILYRASVSEMFIPYGDPSHTQYIKNAFDVGECGLGFCANSLELGCDCPGPTYYFDAAVNDSRGKARTIKNAICLHEEDDGILWKHVDARANISEVRRSRRLVVSSVATIGNYDYGFYWHFHQDGSMEFEVKLTGIISTGAVRQGDNPLFGTLVSPGLYGPNHQHFFCVRLDTMIDGMSNSVYECDSVAIPPGEENPFGNAWTVQSTLLTTEAEAQRHVEPAAHRFWKITNSQSHNKLGQPVAYGLFPGANAWPLLAEAAPPLLRAGFVKKHLWVTAYDSSELFAAGDYPILSTGGEGLPAYSQSNRPISNTDLVVWYVFGAHHVVRPEDWPVMPVSHIGFSLKPIGFFEGNPALDVPRPPGRHCAT